MYPIDNLDDPIGLFGNELVFPDTYGIETKVVFDREEPAKKIALGGVERIFMKPEGSNRLKSPATREPTLYKEPRIWKITY